MHANRYFAAVSVLVLMAGCSAPVPEKVTASSPTTSLAPFTSVAVRSAPDREEIPVSGLLASETEARLSFKTGGIIQKITVKEGDAVRAGQLLATLNLTEIQAQVDQANENLLKAERDLERIKALFATQVATQEQLENAKTGYQVALRSREIAGYNLGFSEIRASGPGVVVKKLMNEGELAGPGNPVFFLAGSSAVDWVLRCGLSDVQWAKTARGDQALITLDAYPETSWVAVVSRRASAAEPGTGLYRVDLQVQPGSRPLATGLFGRGHLRVRSAPGLWEVPVQALQRVNDDRGTVLRVLSNGLEPVPVTVVNWTSDTVVVAGGLSLGDRVVDQGGAYLAPSLLALSVPTERHP